jgi:hypothetical protein
MAGDGGRSGCDYIDGAAVAFQQTLRNDLIHWIIFCNQDVQATG